MPVESLPIFAYYDKQRFTQFGAMDCANWYHMQVSGGKKKQALYPAMGRRHVVSFGQNKLIFDSEPTALFKTVNFAYIIVGTRVIQIDKFFNEIVIGSIPLGKKVWFDFLPVGDTIYAMLTAETNIYLITETPAAVTMVEITDPLRPSKPAFVASFGNRFVVSQRDSPDYYVSAINVADLSNPATSFTVNGSSMVNRASGVIGQMTVLHNQLYILCDYKTDVWSNIQTQLPVAGGGFKTFPFKLNSSYNWNYGIADPFSLSRDYGMMTWLARNTSGAVTFMSSNGQQPEEISSEAINVLLEQSVVEDGLSPFQSGNANGFLYQYEKTIFYRVSAGKYRDFGNLDINESANCIEYNFSTKTWSRATELNGERNRIQKHVYFNSRHLVTVSGDSAMYQMAGNIYRNELRTPNTTTQAVNAFTKYPMRYSLVTEHIFLEDYSEFITDYVEIDFVFGDRTFYESEAPFDNTIFIIAEDGDPACPVFLIAEDQANANDVFLIMEEGNTPGFNDNHYNKLFKPHIELYYSDDGGITFITADLERFSPLGQHRWRMRWYELGASRNRCYKLVCVSSAPIVVLGAVQNIRRASGGGN